MQLKSRIRTRHLVAIVVTGLLALLVGTAVAGSDERVCVRCHDVEAEGRDGTAHASTSCYDCHLQQGDWSYPGFKATELGRMYPAKLLGGEPSGSSVRIGTAACLSCHSDIVNQKEPVQARGLNILHSTCAQGAQCTDCHTGVGHGAASRDERSIVMEDCVRCHIEEAAPRECDTCHAGKRERDRLVTRNFQVTHGPDWRKTHGLGDLSLCRTCHEDDSCTKCHGIVVPHPTDFGVTHGAAVQERPDSCATCHTSAEFCSDCHRGVQMPHPGDFLKRHSSLAMGIDDPSCQRCHTVGDCQTCHERHIHPGGATGVPGTSVKTTGGADR